MHRSDPYNVPRIAVIGNQSAGKSSLVEAISGISVPRDAGTCTRTPYEVQLKSSTLAWSCRISLRFIFDDVGVDCAPRQVLFGPTLVDPAHVEPMLRKAQIALLHPGAAPNFFVDLDGESIKRIDQGELPPGCKKRLSFSPNVVCVAIEGRDAVDLTFVDLPGIISNVNPGDDPNDIQLIRSLATRHATGNCLILCAFSMKDDLKNQSASLLAKEADPEGTRTIGVLTKADTLQEGEHSRWLEVLRGKRHRLAQGYFCTKLRGLADLQANTTSYEESRLAEETFFRTEVPWNALKGEIRHRLGTKSLVDFLGERLSAFMSTKIPDLIGKTSSLLADVNSQLDRLPPPPSRDPIVQLGTLVNRLVANLQGYATGTAGHKSLIQDVGEVLDSFKLDVQATEPRFTPFESSNPRQKDWEMTVVAYSSSDKGRAVGPGGVASRKRRLEELGIEVDQDRAPAFALEMDLEQVQHRIKKARTRELPQNVPYDAKTDLVTLSLRGWPVIVDACIERVRPIVHQCVHQLVGAHFARFDQGALCSMIRSTMLSHVDELFAECRKHLDYFISLEKTTTTRNTHFHTSTHGHLVALFNAARKDPPADALVNSIITAASAAGNHITREAVVKMLNGEEFVEEIDAMASVQAYWKVAYKRIIDNIPRVIDADIVQRLHEGASVLLNTKVGLYEPDARERAHKLVSEKASITKEREELLGRRTRLEEARVLLSAFDEDKLE